jgi:hypothetical protein
MAAYLKKFFPLCILLYALRVSNSCAQLVNEKFDQLSLSENFDSTNAYWTTLANADNLFIVQEGEYILNRKTILSPFAIIANYENELSAFRLVTSVKLEKSLNDDGTIGIIFMAQSDGKGGFIFEINKLKQYRVRQITGLTYKYLTGELKTGGWINSKFINETNAYNLVEIKTFNRNYDIYINNNFLISFSEIAYKSGRMGIVIGPGSKGRVDFIYLFSSSKSPDAVASDGIQNTQMTKEQGPDIIELTESIIKLKTQINTLTEKNEDLHKTLEAMKSDDDEVENQKKNYDKTIKDLQTKIGTFSFTYDSLMKINQVLLKYKEMVAGNENSDLVISLSKALKTEKESNEMMIKQNKALTDSLSVLMKNSKSKNPAPHEIKNNEKPPGGNDTNTKGFVLPKEGN